MIMRKDDGLKRLHEVIKQLDEHDERVLVSCQIEFKHLTEYEDRPKQEDSRYIYQTIAGMPGTEHGMLVRFHNFFKWCDSFSLELTSAQYLAWSKNYDFRHLREAAPHVDFDTIADKCLRRWYHICGPGHFHKDIEYYYEAIYSERGQALQPEKELIVEAYEVKPAHPDQVTRADFRHLGKLLFDVKQ